MLWFDDPPLGVLFWRFVPPCMAEELGETDYFGSDDEDSGAVINEEGRTTFNGFSLVAFGVFLLVFSVEVLAFGVFMVGKECEEEDVKKVNESDGLMGLSE